MIHVLMLFLCWSSGELENKGKSRPVWARSSRTVFRHRQSVQVSSIRIVVQVAFWCHKTMSVRFRFTTKPEEEEKEEPWGASTVWDLKFHCKFQGFGQYQSRETHIPCFQEVQESGDFFVQPSTKINKLDTSQWPLLLKVSS